MITDRDKIDGLIWGGAIGDMFGAPVEGIRNLTDIKKTFGEKGIQHPMPYKSFWDDCELEGVGVITDDTTMAACTLAALIEQRKLKQGDDMWLHKSLDRMWQYYLVWGSKQQYGEDLAEFIQPETNVPDYLDPLLFRCGAGKGTIAAMLTGKRGEPHDPVHYDTVLGEKQCVGPNAGCGGMMRVPPVALYHDEMDIIGYGARTAAITHGHPDAIAATVVVAMLTANAMKEYATLQTAWHETRNNLCRVPGHDVVQACFEFAATAFATNKCDIQTMDALGYAHGKNAFLALPVLTQTLFAIMAAADVKTPSPEAFKDVMRLAVNHTGDSDSVGAVVGSIVGANWGYKNLPHDWIDVVDKKSALDNLCNQVLKP